MPDEHAQEILARHVGLVDTQVQDHVLLLADALHQTAQQAGEILDLLWNDAQFQQLAVELLAQGRRFLGIGFLAAIQLADLLAQTTQQFEMGADLLRIGPISVSSATVDESASRSASSSPGSSSPEADAADSSTASGAPSATTSSVS